VLAMPRRPPPGKKIHQSYYCDDHPMAVALFESRREAALKKKLPRKGATHPGAAARAGIQR